MGASAVSKDEGEPAEARPAAMADESTSFLCSWHLRAPFRSPSFKHKISLVDSIDTLIETT